MPNKTIEKIEKYLEAIKSNVDKSKIFISQDDWIDKDKTVELVLLNRYMNKKCIYCGSDKCIIFNMYTGLHECDEKCLRNEFNLFYKKTLSRFL